MTIQRDSVFLWLQVLSLRYYSFLVILLVFSMPYQGIEEEHKIKDSLLIPQKSTVSPAKRLVYKPPFRGAPKRRVFGGSRGEKQSSIILRVLAPEHTGITYNEQPTLFWFISKIPDVAVEITIQGERFDDILLDVLLPSVQKGINQISLKDFQVILVEGIEYQWSVSVILDADNRSRDITSIGYIQKKKSSPDFRDKITTAPLRDQILFYAEYGIWYDALNKMSENISNVEVPYILNWWQEMLIQGGLGEIATHLPK